MKLTQFLAVFLGLVLTVLQTNAYDFKDGNFYFDVTSVEDRTVELTFADGNYNSYSGEVTIPSVAFGERTYTVTGIGAYAFKDCSGMTKVVVPPTVEYIGSGAFEGCTSLSYIDLEDGEKDLFTAFQYMRYHEMVGLIYRRTFANCPITSAYIGRNLTYSTDSPVGHPFGDTPELTEVVFGKYVTKIKENFFNGCSNLTSVRCISNITDFGKQSFYQCSKLSDVQFGSSVKTIGESAFEGCTSLTSFDFSEQLESLGARAFYNSGISGAITISSIPVFNTNTFWKCPITSLTIGIGVTRIDGSFADYPSLEILDIAEAETPLAWIGGSSYGVESPMHRISIGRPLQFGNYSPIGKCNKLEYLHIGKFVHEIPANFVESESLTDITGCENVKVIGQSAFYKCTNLKAFPFNTQITNIGDDAFYNCGLDGSIELPECKEIGGGAFSGCRITEVILQNVQNIGSYAFCECDNLSVVNLGDKLETIGEYAFAFCATLKSLDLGESITLIPERLCTGCTSLTDVHFGNLVERIESSAFYNCPLEIDELYFSAKMSSVGPNAFTGTKTIKRLVIEDSPDKIIISTPGSGKTWINYDVIQELYMGRNVDSYNFCYVQHNLVKLDLGEFVTKIDSYMFGSCGLEKIEIGKNVTTIGYKAFDNCKNVSKIYIPESVQIIGNDAFSNVSAGDIWIDNLESWLKVDFGSRDSNPMSRMKNNQLYVDGVSTDEIFVPDAITEIKNYAFYGCKPLTKVHTGNETVSIGQGAFCSLSELSELTIGPKTTSIGTSAFLNSNKMGIAIIKSMDVEPPVIADKTAFGDYTYLKSTLYVPTGSADKYREAEYWKEFKNIQEMSFSGVESPVEESFGVKPIVRWYNLNGIEVENPSGGVFIKIENGNATTVHLD